MSRTLPYKRIISLLVLLTIFIWMFTELALVFTPKRNKLPWNITSKIKGFYELEENSLDVVFLGSSHSFCSFNPAVFYKEKGIKSYVFASNEQPLWLTYHYLKEVLKTQQPKVVVLESFYISENADFKKDGINKLSLDDLPLSINKIEAQKASFKDNLEGVNPFYNYHDRWKDLSIVDFKTTDHGLLKGFTPLYKSTPRTIENFNVTKADLPLKSRLYLDKIIELSENNNFSLIITYTPYMINKSRSQHIVKLEEITSKKKIPFINYTDSVLLKSINFDAQLDFEEGHTNIMGAEKVSKHLSEYLSKEYNLESSEVYEDYEILKSRFYATDSLKKITNFEEYLDYLSKMDVYIAVTSMDAIDRKTLVPFKKLGSKINFKNKFRISYTGLFNKYRNYAVEKLDTLAIINKMNPDDVRKFYVRLESANYNVGNYSKIYINNIDHLVNKSKRGFNIVVYDAVTNQILDIASFDTFGNEDWIRY